MIKYVIVCDVCHTEGYCEKPGDIGFHPTIKVTLMPGQEPMNMDLCDQCGQELAFWIKAGGIKNNGKMLRR